MQKLCPLQAVLISLSREIFVQIGKKYLLDCLVFKKAVMYIYPDI